MMVTLHTLAEEMKGELDRVLTYWSNKSIDLEHGGFVGELDNRGNVRSHSGKGAVLNARILWTFSSAYNFNGNKHYLTLAKRAYDYLIANFWDTKHGGLIWKVDHEGKPISTRKQTYAQAFGIYGLSEYYKASGLKDSMHYALSLYDIIENKLKDPVDGGYIEALNEDWSVLSDMRLSDKDHNEPKSMNTHLHVLEAYSNLYRVWPETKLKEDLRALLDIFTDKIINPVTHHFELFFDMHWHPKSATISYGHNIEGAWLLTEAAHLYDAPLLTKKIEDAALHLVDATIKTGIDLDGGLFNEKDDDFLDTDKHWWPQAEAMVGLMDAYAITHDAKYLDMAIQSWTFIKSSIIDSESGEWFWRVNKEGTPDRTEYKVGFWKCPYHNSRAMMEMIRRTHQLQ